MAKKGMLLVSGWIDAIVGIVAMGLWAWGEMLFFGEKG